MKTPTVPMDVTITITLTKVINIPAKWTDEQIDKYMFSLDVDEFYGECYPDNIDVTWKNHKKKEVKNA